jgi:ArsR family transcriptional regulator
MKDADTDTFQSDFCAGQLKTLGEPLRLRIIDLLRHGEMTVGGIAECLDVELVTASHHLKVLKQAKLVTPRREGRFMYYSLEKDLLKTSGKHRQYLDLGCCRLEVPLDSAD